eukprot:scaffold63936_cov36-Phaeocystis_antarctica.AAC.1
MCIACLARGRATRERARSDFRENVERSRPRGPPPDFETPSRPLPGARAVGALPGRAARLAR